MKMRTTSLCISSAITSSKEIKDNKLLIFFDNKVIFIIFSLLHLLNL